MKKEETSMTLMVRKFLFVVHSFILVTACLVWSNEIFVLTGVFWCLLYGGMFFVYKREDGKMSKSDIAFFKGGYVAHMIIAGIIIWSYMAEHYLVTAVAGAGIGLFWSVILFAAYRNIKKEVNMIEEELKR